jgi:hypothetical protein
LRTSEQARHSLPKAILQRIQVSTSIPDLIQSLSVWESVLDHTHVLAAFKKLMEITDSSALSREQAKLVRTKAIPLLLSLLQSRAAKWSPDSIAVLLKIMKKLHITHNQG